MYCEEMRDKRMYRDRDIIMEEVRDFDLDTKQGEIVRAIAVTGEYLVFEEV